MKTRLGILISGTGSNMQCIAKACEHADFPAEIALVISNNPQAKGIDIAANSGLPTTIIDHRKYAKRADFEQQIHEQWQRANVDLVCLAGFMRILSPFLVSKWSGNMVNIHPSLLPSFTGLHTHKRVLEAGHSEHGCTVHQVTEGLDEGPILGQARIKVLKMDTETTLQARVLEAEHQLYPLVVKRTCQKMQGADVSPLERERNGGLISLF